ncbi:Disease resistance protein [Nymphaea thermarum]|nr:Disease resistance protein [Nymphaea thermarum]
MDVVEHLVGIQSRVEDVMKLLSLETEDVKMIGIHGMGGIGKTTLAKVVYNQMFKSFDASCFLSDIRETSKQHKGLILLQEKLISEILNFEKFEITDVSQGIATIKSRFHTKRLLIVLDDVDHNNQLDALVGSRHWFCGGSRIIITTRYKHVLNVHKLNKDEFYQPGELNRVESLELFSLHAFEKSQPANDYIGLSDKIIKAAGGLPLALEVLGAFLFGKKDVKEWEDLLEGLQHIPFDDVQRRLKLSYDSLDPEEKKIFLDLACFFISPTKDRVTDILKSCGFYASLAITVLQHRSLVKIDKNRLEMHDQLRELGKGIVRENSSFNPGLCSRLWVTDEVLDVLDNQKGTGNIEGIVVDLRGLLSKRRVKTKSFARMMKLRLLRANFAEFEGNFKHMPTGLRWLEWHGCPLKSLPNDFSLEKVAVLDLSLSRVVQLWSSRCYFRKKVFNELKVLILSGCSHLKKTPDFSSSPRLEKLILKGCQELIQVDESIGKLDRLAVLDLSLCSKLERLPNAICSLSSLKNLDLSRCTDLQMLPMQWGVMGSFRSLRQLSLFRCSNLQELPDSFGVMPRLEKLNLRYCQSLKTLPDSIGDMKRLSELYLTNVALVQLPSSIGSLVELKGLWMFGCNKLKSLPDTLGQLMKLEKLDLSYCKSLKMLPPSVGSMKNLVELFFNFVDIKELPKSTGSLGSLQKLSLQGCNKLVVLPDGFDNLTNLEKLDLRGCSSFKKLPDSIGNMKSLTEILLARTSIELLPDSLASIRKLKKLNIQSCTKLRSLPLGMMRSLRYLYVKGRGEEEYKDDDCFEIPESMTSKSWHSHNSQEYRRLEFTSCEEAYGHFKIQWKLIMRVENQEWVVLVIDEHKKEWGMHRGMQWLRLIFPTALLPVEVTFHVMAATREAEEKAGPSLLANK